MDTPVQVSVIIPLYNYGRFLLECVQSVERQTYPVKEIIIVNDGSTDNSLEVAKEIARFSSKIKIIDKKNGGLSSARNAGISESTGTHYMTLDADDKLTPAAIEEHVKLLDSNRCIAQCALLEFGERYVLNVPPERTSLERVMQANTMYCNCLFPRHAWVEVGGYDEHPTMRLGYEDWEFNIRVLACGYYVRTSDFIALRYRVHEGQMTQATSHPRRQELYDYIYQKNKDLYESKNLRIAGFK